MVPLGYLWWASRAPSTYNVMDMGYVDLGGGPGSTQMHHGAGEVSVADLTGPKDGTPDVDLTLTARQQSFRLASGEQVSGYTLDGTSPGPTIHATVGDLVQVTLVNKDVDGGVTLHWHGVDVPNAEDGVAGVTQDAVPPGGRFVYRFVAPHEGTYWYHSHQVSHEQVKGGLFGVLVVSPREPPAAEVREVIAPVHSYSQWRTIAGRTGVQRTKARAGEAVRLRLINTNNGPLRAWVSGAPFQVGAIDGYEVNRPTDLSRRTLVLAAGGRYDLTFTVPSSGAVRLDIGGGTALVVGDGKAPPLSPQPPQEFDALHYGAPAALPFDVSQPDRRFDYRIGRRIGFKDGRPGFWWSINGHLWPDVPMYTVAEGDVVTMTISNSSGDVHPMHLHGHHAVVLSRDGKKATGSPWWVDSLNVEDGETFVIAFLADNPGIWMDHCHNLDHATQGLVAHLAYEGVTEPFTVGTSAQPGTHNHPE